MEAAVGSSVWQQFQDYAAARYSSRQPVVVLVCHEYALPLAFAIYFMSDHQRSSDWAGTGYTRHMTVMTAARARRGWRSCWSCY
jgi:hypothetical protein